ncbi:hypothetical protein DFH08DRAFT_964488 [Mycena albidolilacea]|uniref:Transmembrane protein n=1 Tax=Mycena albidolilacea TaxID=1033008 RepID=A0AAD6ZU92_9AGAR|nr:hypothetical protein DFH08DRAFT_964488 [Mycena albidolilacea]
MSNSLTALVFLVAVAAAQPVMIRSVPVPKVGNTSMSVPALVATIVGSFVGAILLALVIYFSYRRLRAGPAVAKRTPQVAAVAFPASIHVQSGNHPRGDTDASVPRGSTDKKYQRWSMATTETAPPAYDSYEKS